MEIEWPGIIHPNPFHMRLITGAFIVLLCVTVCLIVSFKHISAETLITKTAYRPSFAKLTTSTSIGNTIAWRL